jgi:hypothetical protein
MRGDLTGEHNVESIPLSNKLDLRPDRDGADPPHTNGTHPEIFKSKM